MNSKTIGIFQMVVGIFLIVASVFFNYDSLMEAYGAGSPYYSRTTNMDKWSNPIPSLVLINMLSLLITVLLLRSGFRRIRK